ncbi:stalk domain-containing protein [Paenibacillus sp. FSL W7-1279]|uniref:stalk domain-containing protein n=1 Tax=Paenibacillus sp. FSL W7-1279 TaxID=2921697 RepID=UPI0011A5E324
MKKWAYVLGGVVIGALIATSGNAIAAQVKSLVGQKVTGEYKVVVNGKELQDKGAVISGRTNAPVRAISESLGADLKVDNKTKTITITTNETHSEGSGNTVTEVEDTQASSLIKHKEFLETEIERLTISKEYHEDQYEKSEGLPKEIFKQALDGIVQQLSERTEELKEVDAQLATLNK